MYILIVYLQLHKLYGREDTWWTSGNPGPGKLFPTADCLPEGYWWEEALGEPGEVAWWLLEAISHAYNTRDQVPTHL